MTTTKTDGDKKLMAAAKQIVKSLESSKDLTDDMILILSNFDNRLASITELFSKSSLEVRKNKIVERIQVAEKVIHRWDSTCSNPRRRNSIRWEESADAANYLLAVDDVLKLTEEDLTPSSGDLEINDRAKTVIQQAMSRLEDEFRRVLIRNAVPLDTSRLKELEDSVSSRSCSLSFALNDGCCTLVSDDGGEVEKSVDGGGEMRESIRLERGHLVRERSLSRLYVDLINPVAVTNLKEIADRMIKAGYEKELCQVYVGSIREVLDECLSTVGCEKLSIEEVQKIEGNLLTEKKSKWIQALKIVIGVLLPSEKRLCDQVFGGSELMREACFTETTKGCVRQLFNFAEAVAIGKRAPDKLFDILDMYEALDVMMRDLQALFPIEWGENVCEEARGILDRLGEAANGTLQEFKNLVLNHASRKVAHDGSVHPLTSYVMNYLKYLVDYDKTLNLLLDSNKNKSDGSGGDETVDLSSSSPLGCYLLELISLLESNLTEKSKLYEDGGLQCIFLMNNILYIIKKVTNPDEEKGKGVKDSDQEKDKKGKDSDLEKEKKEDSEKLKKLMGDNWVRKHRGQVRQYATSYLRASWSKPLSFLKDEGLGGSGGASSVSKVLLKERFKSFNLCFEEIYHNQTAWKVSDKKLRDELQLSISERVFPAYRSFLGRFHSHLDRGRHAGKYIKYSSEDLENYLLDFFEGKPAVLHHPRRKPSA